MKTQKESLRKHMAAVSIIIIILVQLILGVKSLTSIDAIPSYDAYTFIQISETIQTTHQMPVTTPHTYVATPVAYQTSHPLIATLISNTSGLDIETVYRFAGPLIFAFLILSFYTLTKRLFKNRGIGLLGAVLLGLVPYNLYRSTMPLAENLSLIVHVMIFFILVYDKISYNKKAFIISILLIGATYQHYRSIAIPATIVVIYFAITFFQHYRKKSKSWPDLMPLLIIAAFYSLSILPIISSVFAQYSVYLSPAQYSWRELEPVPSRYVLPSYADYKKFLGTINIIFAGIGIISFLAMIRKLTPIQISIGIWFLVTLLLTQSLRFGFYAVPLRFFPYFSLPLIIVAILGIRKCIAISVNNHKQIVAIIVIMIISSYSITQFVYNNQNKAIFVGFYPSDFEAAQLLNKQAADSITLSYGTMSPSLGVKNSEGRAEVIHDILLSNSNEDLNNKLNEYYPDNYTIYFFIINTMATPFEERYANFPDVLERSKLSFSKAGTRIYQLK